MEVAHLVSLICGKRNRMFCLWQSNEGLHLHVVGSHQRPGDTVQIDSIILLVDVIGFYLLKCLGLLIQASLGGQRHLQLVRQLFAALLRPAQDPQAGCL